MPEGDTIHRAAQTLHRAMAGAIVTRFETVLPRLARVDATTPLAGRTIEAVRAAGKHLLVEFSGALTLRTHMRMSGSWHIYRPGERWRRRSSDARIVVETAEWVAVGFSIPDAEFLSAGERARSETLRRLGPDPLAEEFDAADAVARLRAARSTSIADALLDQRVMAGIGNVYKSEILFLRRLDPFAPVDALSDEVLAGVVEEAKRAMRANVARPDGPAFPRAMRQTTRRLDPGAKLWVYGRGGKRCRVCGTAIRWQRQGTSARSTYWCPRCQTR